jgi:hypothetical protein
MERERPEAAQPRRKASMNEGPDHIQQQTSGGGALRTAANQSVSVVPDQPSQIEQRGQEVVERPC